MSEIILLAHTAEKESMSEDGVFWWKEYRLVHNFVHEWVVELRYVCRVQSCPGLIYARRGGKVAFAFGPENAWEFWGKGGTPEEAIDDVLGDGDFFKAESLHDLHKEAVAKLRALREQNERKSRAREEYERAATRFAAWKREVNETFQKQHGHKTGEAYQKAFKKSRDRLQAEHDRLRNEVETTRRALECLA